MLFREIFTREQQENLIENRTNRSTCVATIENAGKDVFDACCARLSVLGFEIKEAYADDRHAFCAMLKENTGVYVNYYSGTKELRVVEEENTKYFGVSDRTTGSFQPSITQISLEDFGLSCVVRLSDGRFIIIDGGRNLEQESNKLLKCLKDGVLSGKPVIAAWILSHPHPDHYHCFNRFMELYADEVEIQRIMFNFPEADDTEHYPALADESDTPYGDLSGTANLPIMHEMVKKSGAYVYAPHTGQRFTLGDAEMEVLASMDDTIHVTQYLNATALIIRMKLAGQTILWTTDGSFSFSKLPERYGEYLKSDILQIPHHGFQSGTAEAEIEGYKLIQPDTCILPTDDYIAYTFFCQFRKSARFLMLWENVKEIVTGNEQRTLLLPYTPAPDGRTIINRLLKEGSAASGARSWVFTGLDSGNPDDFRFTVLNMVIPPANIQIDIFFEVKAKAVRYIKTLVEGGCMKKIDILGGDVEDDALAFNKASLKRRGVSPDQPFAIRFLSDVPIVVFHEKHKPTYYSAL